MRPLRVQPHPIACNHADAALNTATLAIALNIDGDQVPDEIQLLPAGPQIRGRDGRVWLNDRPELVIANTQDSGIDLPLDWEHATEHQAPYGGPAPAAAWLDPQTLNLRDGALWINASWNARGRDSVAAREYRYISPVFEYESESRRIVRLLSAALTNRPNLRLQALNHQQENHPMDPRLLAALGLPQEATLEQVLAALNTIRTKLTETESALQTARNAAATPDPDQYVPIARYNTTLERATTAEAALERAQNAQQTPDLTTFVPRPDYDAAIERATNAESALQAHADAARQSEIDAAINAARDAGKITPASVDYHRAACAQEGGLDRFKAFVEATPVIVPDSGLDDKTPPKSQGTLTPEEKALCQQMGLDPAEYLKEKELAHAAL